MRSEPVLRLGLEVMLGFREPGELGFQEKHTQPTNKMVGEEEEKVFRFGIKLEGHVRKESAVFCQINA